MILNLHLAISEAVFFAEAVLPWLSILAFFFSAFPQEYTFPGLLQSLYYKSYYFVTFSRSDALYLQSFAYIVSFSELVLRGKDPRRKPV